jgi:xanthine dehydrogenase accessory factor
MSLRLSDLRVLIRGGGEMASGIAHKLHRCHMKVFVTETAMPTVVRRTVSFAEAIYEGSCVVEGVCARNTADSDEAHRLWERGEIPVFIDPEALIREILKPSVVVDAIMAKKNLGTDISFAPLVIGVGPGFNAGVDVHAGIESNRGYDLGRVIWSGRTAAGTGVPASVNGYSEERVLRAPHAGRFRASSRIGDVVNTGDVLARVEGSPVSARIKGIIRGMLKDGLMVEKGMKIGDIDPRGEKGYCYSISDKSRAIAGGVLEAILHSFNPSIQPDLHL